MMIVKIYLSFISELVTLGSIVGPTEFTLVFTDFCEVVGIRYCWYSWSLKYFTKNYGILALIKKSVLFNRKKFATNYESERFWSDPSLI